MVCPGINSNRVELQPWLYFTRVSDELASRGHTVSKVESCTQTDGDFDVIVEAVGPFTPFHRAEGSPARCLKVGVLTHPLYNLEEILRAGLPLVVGELRHTHQHLLGTMSRRMFIRRIEKMFDLYIVQSPFNGMRLSKMGVPGNKIEFIPPGLDQAFANANRGRENRLSEDRCVITYIGSALPLRGAQDLAFAFRKIGERFDNAELNLLIRPDEGTNCHSARLKKATAGIDRANVGISWLTRTEVLDALTTSDIVIFPFRLVPSDMPVGPLEALRCGCKVIVPDLAGLANLRDYGAICYPQSSIAGLIDAMSGAISDVHGRLKGTSSSMILDWNGVGDVFERCLASSLSERSR